MKYGEVSRIWAMKTIVKNLVSHDHLFELG